MSMFPSRDRDGAVWTLSEVRKAKKYDVKKEIRRLARERVGGLPSPKVIIPKTQRKKPNHKKPPQLEEL